MFKFIKPTLLLGTLFVSLITPMQWVKAQPLSSSTLLEAIRNLDNSVKTALNQRHDPGLAVGIIYQDQVLFLRGYGVRKMGKPDRVDPNTLFQLGSISKPISATLIAILQKSAQINLYDPVEPYLPIELPSSRTRHSVKLWHLLSHTSGLPRFGFNQQIEAFKPRDSILHNLENTLPLSRPGEKFDYHNVVFSLIENVTEQKTSRDFESLLQEHLFNPLHMAKSSTNYAALMDSRDKAWPHGLAKIKKSSRNRVAHYHYVPYRNYSQAYYERARAAAGVNSNISDLLSFLKLQMGYAPNILNNHDLKTFHSPYTVSPGVASSFRRFFPKAKLEAYYGLGWRILDINGMRLVYHGGWLKGFTNFLGFLPDSKIGIVILHHAESRLSTDLAMHFFKRMLNPQIMTASAKPALNRHRRQHR